MSKLTFDKAFELALLHESAALNARLLSNPTAAPVHYASPPAGLSKDQPTGKSCYRCGGNHNARECRFKDAVCNYGRKKGHIQRVCRSRDRQQHPRNSQPPPTKWKQKTKEPETHRMEDHSERPIAYASRPLSSAERNYAQLDKEALSIVFGVKHFHQYLYGRKFIIMSDHKPLQYLLGETRGIPPMASARIQRWALMLSAYHYEICYRPGADHANADGLSRLPLPDHVTNIPVPGDVLYLFGHWKVRLSKLHRSGSGQTRILSYLECVTTFSRTGSTLTYWGFNRISREQQSSVCKMDAC